MSWKEFAAFFVRTLWSSLSSTSGTPTSGSMEEAKPDVEVESSGEEEPVAEEAQGLKKMRNSLKGFQSAVTRKRKALERAVEQHKGWPSAMSLARMTELSAALTVALEKFENSTERACDMDEERREKYLETAEGIYEMCQAVQETATDAAYDPREGNRVDALEDADAVERCQG